MTKKKNAFNSWFNLNFTVCPYCGYNNEEKRFQAYGSCLRCHKVIDQKIYLRRRLWEANHKRKLREDNYYE